VTTSQDSTRPCPRTSQWPLTDHAAARLSTGRFGYCEQCGADIPVARLATIPEARYCPGCSSGRHDQPWVIQAWLLAVLTA